MRIAFDAQLFAEVQKTGIGYVAQNLINEFLKYEENQYIGNFFSLGFNNDTKNNIRELSKKGVILNECKWFNSVIYKLIWAFIPLPYSIFFRKNVDVTCFFNYYVPPFSRGKNVTIVYDMVCMDCPETMASKNRIMMSLALKKSVKRADKIIVISEFTKQRVMHYLKVNSDKIVVMPLSADFSRWHNKYSKNQIKSVCSNFGIEKDYFLYLGTLEPRKNIEGIIESYSLFCKKNKNVPILVIAGKKGWLFESIFEKVKNLNLSDKVIFTGYVSDLDAPILMNGAKAFIFPSFYEGFGLPPLEAMACGTPVITSNCASLPEVVGDSGILVAPNNYEQIADAMYKIFSDFNFAESLSKKGLERSKLFSWEKSANIFIKACEQTLKGDLT